MRAQRQPQPPSHADLRGLVAPTAYGDLILPTGAVAEVVTYDGEVRIRRGGPKWLLGDLEWRDQKVPLIDLGDPVDAGFSQADAGRRRQHPSALICVTPSGNRALPYIALLVAATPRLVRLRAEDLSPVAEAPERPFARYDLEYLGRPAWVPSLDALEREGLLLGLLSS